MSIHLLFNNSCSYPLLLNNINNYYSIYSVIPLYWLFFFRKISQWIMIIRNKNWGVDFLRTNHQPTTVLNTAQLEVFHSNMNVIPFENDHLGVNVNSF
jgi:hypothetical protein